MDLGAATHFAQGWSIEIVEEAREIGVGLMRDEIPWNMIEQEPGVFAFTHPNVAFPARLAASGIDLRLVFPYGNPLYDEGGTPHSEEALAAYAEYIAQVLHRYPLVRSIEVGNEFNSQSFVFGHVKEAPYDARNSFYLAMIRAVSERLDEEFPNVEILGGAAHSIPVAYLREQVELGVLDYADGLAFNPYTTPPEHLETQVAILREAIAPADPPLHAPEFGNTFDTFEDAPPYLVKMASAMAAARFETAIWYALREQQWFPRMELVASDGALRPAGEAYAFMKNEVLARGEAERLPADDFTRLYRFGDSALVAWGLPRGIEFAEAAEFFDARGRPIAAPAALDPDAPVIALFDGPVDMQAAIRLAPQAVLADTYWEFDPRLDAEGRSGNWTYGAETGEGIREPLGLMEGGAVQSEGWTPYIGSNWRRPLGISPRGLIPVDFGTETQTGPVYSVFETFTAPSAVQATICGVWEPSADSTDGVTLTISHDGAPLFDAVVSERTVVWLPDIDLEEGDAVDFLIGPNESPAGDWTQRTIRLVEAGADQEHCVFPAGG